ncbi:MAG: signal peptidase I [Acidimicrobiales bacterium]
MPAADPTAAERAAEKPKPKQEDPDHHRRDDEHGRRGSFLRELLVLLVTALVIAVGVKTFVAQAFYIPSGSMLPQLEVGDRIVVSKLAYKLHDPRRGDVVVFDSPNPRPKDTAGPVARVVRGLAQAVGVAAPSTDEFVKRVVGLPGETVEAHGGRVFVNGRELIEPYLPTSTVINDFGQVRVPDGHVFVMGDNRENSADSRVFGPIPTSTIVGRAVVRVWPLPNASYL